MKHKLVILLSMVGLLALKEGIAQDKKTISLSDAIDMSIRNSHQLKNGQAEIDEAEASLKEETQKRLPNASVSGSYLRLNAANFDLKTKDNNNSGGSTNETPSVKEAAYGLLNISLPIYSGGRIKYGIESSRYLAQAARLDVENDRDEVIQNTVEAFANLFKAKTAVGLVRENLLQSQQRVKDFSSLEKNGLLPRNDLLKAELQTSNVELSLLDAENNWQLANINMNIMLGLPDGTEIVLDTAGIEKRDDTRTLEDFIQTATSSRKDMSALDLRKKAAQTDVRVTKSELYPSLQLTGGYIAADIPHVFTVTNAVNIGAGVSYNIGSLWKTKAKVEKADAKVRQLTENQAMLNDNIRVQVTKSYLTLLSNRKKIDVYVNAVKQAEENYRVVKNRFDNNLATTTDLLDADVAQLQARLSYTLSRADAFVAYSKLLQTAGIAITDFTNK